MGLIQRALTDLMNDEGYRQFVYDDATGEPIGPGYLVKGHPTVGYGRCLDRRGVFKHEAEPMLRGDVLDAIAQLQSRLDFWDSLSEGRQAVLVNMAVNLGVRGTLNFGRMITALRKKDHAAAAAELLDSDAARKLANRYRRLADRMGEG